MTKEQTLHELHNVILQARELRNALKKVKADLMGAHEDFSDWHLCDKLTDNAKSLSDLSYDCGAWISGQSEEVFDAVAETIGKTLQAAADKSAKVKPKK